jgi:uncharacterized Tic20 family protein
MNLSELREKVTIFSLPIFIVGIVLGGLIALIGKVYFWDVSQISLQFAEGSTSTDGTVRESRHDLSILMLICLDFIILFTSHFLIPTRAGLCGSVSFSIDFLQVMRY